MSPDVYERCAAPGIRLAKETNSKVFAIQAAGSIFRSYNLLLDLAARCEDLEALVLVHEDAELLDPDFCAKLREALSDADVGVVGCVGAVGVRSIAWWEGSRTYGSFVQRYPELGGGEFNGVGSSNAPEPLDTAHEVECVDGFLLAIAPWAVRNIRFDESLGTHWGYDFDYCLQVRAAGRKVVAAPLRTAHHLPLQLLKDPEPWIAAHTRAAEKWDGRMPGTESMQSDWRTRARRAEAEAVVARLAGASKVLQEDAGSTRFARRMDAVTETASWRVTAPLRRANALRRAIRERRG
jgi:hypothetical protein